MKPHKYSVNCSCAECGGRTPLHREPAMHEQRLSPEARRLLKQGMADAAAGRVSPVDLGSFAKYADDDKEGESDGQ
jgi:hypothetical protein